MLIANLYILKIPYFKVLTFKLLLSQYRLSHTVLVYSLVMQVPGSKLDVLKKKFVENSTDVLFTYRHKCAHASATGQLILPESLKLLPLYTMSLLKTPAIRLLSSRYESAHA